MTDLELYLLKVQQMTYLRLSLDTRSPTATIHSEKRAFVVTEAPW
jgi:hypothetical protein